MLLVVVRQGEFLRDGMQLLSPTSLRGAGAGFPAASSGGLETWRSEDLQRAEVLHAYGMGQVSHPEVISGIM